MQNAEKDARSLTALWHSVEVCAAGRSDSQFLCFLLRPVFRPFLWRTLLGRLEVRSNRSNFEEIDSTTPGACSTDPSFQVFFFSLEETTYRLLYRIMSEVLMLILSPKCCTVIADTELFLLTCLRPGHISTNITGFSAQRLSEEEQCTHTYRLAFYQG